MKLQNVKYIGTNRCYDRGIILLAVRLLHVHKWVAIVGEKDVVVVAGYNERRVPLNSRNWLLRLRENGYRNAD